MGQIECTGPAWEGGLEKYHMDATSALMIALQKEPHLRVKKDVLDLAHLAQGLPFFRMFSRNMLATLCKVQMLQYPIAVFCVRSS